MPIFAKHRAILVITSFALLIVIAITIVYRERQNGKRILFTTLSQNISPAVIRNIGLAPKAPELIIVQSQQDATALEHSQHFITPYNTEEIFNQIRILNYQQDLVILVFQGVKSQGGYEITVNDVRLAGDILNIHATFETPQRWYHTLFGARVYTLMATDPYQIIIVPRDKLSGGQITFNLIGNGTIVYSVQVTVL